MCACFVYNQLGTNPHLKAWSYTVSREERCEVAQILKEPCTEALSSPHGSVYPLKKQKEISRVRAMHFQS